VTAFSPISNKLGSERCLTSRWHRGVICAGHHGNIYPSAPTYSATVVLGSATGATCVLRAVYTDGTVAYSDSDTLGGGNSLALNVTTSQTDPVTINVRCALPAGADLVSISYSVSY
jgi:hypothetical protein